MTNEGTPWQLRSEKEKRRTLQTNQDLVARSNKTMLFAGISISNRRTHKQLLQNCHLGVCLLLPPFFLLKSLKSHGFLLVITLYMLVIQFMFNSSWCVSSPGVPCPCWKQNLGTDLLTRIIDVVLRSSVPCLSVYIIRLYWGYDGRYEWHIRVHSWIY